MIGLIELSGVGIIVLGGVIALIIYNIPQLRFLASHPLLAFGSGMVIAYVLDDFSSQITQGDTIVITLMIVTLIVMVIPIIKDWAKSRKENIRKIEEKINLIERKISKLEGNIETILNLYLRKSRQLK